MSDPLGFLKIKESEEKESPFLKALNISTKGAFTRDELGLMLPFIKKQFPQFGTLVEGLLELKDLADKKDLKIKDLVDYAKKKGVVDFAKKKAVDLFKNVARRYMEQRGGRKKRKPKNGRRKGANRASNLVGVSEKQQKFMALGQPNSSQLGAGCMCGGASKPLGKQEWGEGWKPIIIAPNSSSHGDVKGL